jgi:hypothetical protein
MEIEIHRIFLSRRNLLTLLSKLDRAAAGEDTACTIIKRDTTHKQYPCSCACVVTAVEDADYYTDREPGPTHPADERQAQ